MSSVPNTSDIVRPAARPIQNCAQCRKRKIKCNKTYPCAPCLLRGEGDLCKEVEKNPVSRGSPENMDNVLQRITMLEDTVQKLVRMIPNAIVNGELSSNGSQLTASVTANASGAGTPTTNGSSKTSQSVTSVGKPAKMSTIRSLYGTNTKEEEVAMMLEDFAMGHRVNRDRATQDMEVENPDSFGSPGTLGGRFNTTMSETHPLAMLIDPSVNVWLRSIKLFPSVGKCRELIDFYFERLEWSIKVLHRPTFHAQSEILLDHLASLHATPSTSYQHQHRDIVVDPSAPPPGITISFLGIFLMVLCLSYGLMESNVCERQGIGLHEASQQAKRFFTAAQACLYHEDFLGQHSLEHLQCIILMGAHQQNLDEADAHWALMGSAIKIAQNLGLSRLGSETDSRPYSEHWRSAVKRETARRVWWNLVCDDWSHAAAHNGTYSIHPSQNYTGFPLNINDEDLVDGQKIQPKPAAEYTDMSSTLCRLKFVCFYREIVDNMQCPTGGYEFILDMDNKISQCLKDFPHLFVSTQGEDKDNDHEDRGRRKRQRMNRYGPKDVKDLEMMFTLAMGETRRLRLHRPYLFRGYKDKRYVKSRQQCVDSARTIIQLMKGDRESSAILLKWWIVMFYGFAATVVLFIDLCHHKSDDGPDLANRRLELQGALDMFKAADQVSSVSRNAIALLEGLLNAEPELSSAPTTRKRSVSGEQVEEAEDPFERIVKRIIIDASRGVSSPIALHMHPSPSPQMASPVPSSYSPQSHHPPASSSTRTIAVAGHHQVLHPSKPSQTQPRAREASYGQYSAAAAASPSGVMPVGGSLGYSMPPPQWQFENPFGTRWDLNLFGFGGDGTGNSGVDGNNGLGNGVFPDLSDSSMTDLSQLLLGFGGSVPN